MNIVFTHTAWEQYTEWQREDKKMPILSEPGQAVSVKAQKPSGSIHFGVGTLPLF